MLAGELARLPEVEADVAAAAGDLLPMSEGAREHVEHGGRGHGRGAALVERVGVTAAFPRERHAERVARGAVSAPVRGGAAPRFGRGGQGVANIEVTPRNGSVVQSFPVGEDDQIMLVTNRGQLIRCPVHDIRIARRQTQGVTVFRVGDDEEVVAVAHLSDLGEDEGNGSDEAAPEGEGPTGDGAK